MDVKLTPGYVQAQQAAGLSIKQAASSLNFAVTNGATVVATRCRTDPESDPPTLYFHAAMNGGKLNRRPLKGVASPNKRWKDNKQNEPACTQCLDADHHAVTHKGCYISSEPLDLAPGKWTLLEPYMVVIATHDTVQVLPLDIPDWSDLDKCLSSSGSTNLLNSLNDFSLEDSEVACMATELGSLKEFLKGSLLTVSESSPQSTPMSHKQSSTHQQHKKHWAGPQESELLRTLFLVLFGMLLGVLLVFAGMQLVHVGHTKAEHPWSRWFQTIYVLPTSDSMS